MKPVTVEPAAIADIKRAFQRYDAVREGLGEEFRDALGGSLAEIAENPRLHPIIHRSVRQVSLKRFSYSLFYQERADATVVIACMEGSRALGRRGLALTKQDVDDWQLALSTAQLRTILACMNETLFALGRWEYMTRVGTSYDEACALSAELRDLMDQAGVER
jgi:hypothetical protein